MPKLSEGDTIAMQGEVMIGPDEGRVSVRLQGYDLPVTVRAEHLNIIARRRGRARQAKT